MHAGGPAKVLVRAGWGHAQYEMTGGNGDEHSAENGMRTSGVHDD